MARLNEPAAAPADAIESLRRKFIRQNRDITRVNSTQSLRIQSLENETSRLLTENLGLQGEILRLRRELETGKAQRIVEHTERVKCQMEAKLLEFSALLSGLGDVPSPEKQSQQSEKATSASLATYLDQKDWRNMCTASEGVGRRLPPILENKSYPRKTLEQQEIIDLNCEAGNDITDSPEIGPPPVSQFVDEDLIKIDLPKRTKKNDTSDAITGIDPALSANLEQRRKRRESTGLSDPKRASKPNSIAPGVHETKGTFKTGAKRKLSVRDDGEIDASSRSRPASPDDFVYTRVVNDDDAKTKQDYTSEKPDSKVTRELANARGAPREKSAAEIANRKVLAPKSVNGSPKKKVLAMQDAKANKPENQKPNNSKDIPKAKSREPVKVRAFAELVVNTVEVQPEPQTETPAASSPENPEPPRIRAESRDTPPPTNIGVPSEAQRPSRRARGAVSYAEPSLRDKMRRPTKELVDAVTRDAREKARIVDSNDGMDGADPHIKKEPESDDAWKSVPVTSSAAVGDSPFGNKSPGLGLGLPTSITTHRKRRESILNQTELDIPKSASGGAIAALLSETRKAKAAAKEKEKAVKDEAAATQGMASLGIYEIQANLPSPVEAPPKLVKEEKASTRASRRYSAVSRDGPPHPHQSDSEASDMEGTRKAEKAASHRRQSALGLKSSSSNVDMTKDHAGDRSLKRSTSTTGVADARAGGSRSDRISARRRSMML